MEQDAAAKALGNEYENCKIADRRTPEECMLLASEYFEKTKMIDQFGEYSDNVFRYTQDIFAKVQDCSSNYSSACKKENDLRVKEWGIPDSEIDARRQQASVASAAKAISDCMHDNGHKNANNCDAEGRKAFEALGGFAYNASKQKAKDLAMLNYKGNKTMIRR